MNFTFQITLYICTCPENVVNKTMTMYADESGYMTETSSIQNPIVLVEAVNSVVFQCNYCFIPIFSRYYFIDNVEITGNNLFRFTLRVDPLKSFASDFSSATAFIKRSSAGNTKARYLIDSEIPIQSIVEPIIVEPTNQRDALFDDDGVSNAYYNYIVVLKTGTIYNSLTETLSVYLGSTAFSPSSQLKEVLPYQADASGFASETYGSKYIVCASIYGVNQIVRNASLIGHTSDILAVYKVPINMYTSGTRLFTYPISEIRFDDETKIELHPEQSISGATLCYQVNGACQYIRWCYYSTTYNLAFFPNNNDAYGSTLNAKTKYKLNIPFAQEIELNYADIRDTTYLHIYYSLDLYNGESKYYVIVANERLGSPVTSNKNGIVIAAGNASMMQYVPYATVDTYNYLYQKNNLKLNTEMSQVTHAMSIMGVVGNYTANSALQIANQGIGYHFTQVNNERELEHLRTSSNVSSSSSIFAYSLSKSYIKRYDAVTTTSQDAFIQKRGYVYDTIDTLSNQINVIVNGANYAYDYGYIEASDLYYTSNATTDEKRQIENYFNAGVYYLHET